MSYVVCMALRNKIYTVFLSIIVVYNGVSKVANNYWIENTDKTHCV